MRLTRRILLSVGCLVLSSIALPQKTAPKTLGPSPAKSADKLPEFEVISVKQHRKKDDGWKYDYRDDGFFAVAMTLEDLVKEAFGVFEDDRFVGLPKWASGERYDVEAKVSGDDLIQMKKLTLDQRRLMLQALLAERFQLLIHHGAKVLPVYALLLAKSGARMRASELNSIPPNTIKGMGGLVKRSRSGVLEVERFDMKDLASLLTWDLGRPVIDRTGLTGRYDFTLDWSPEEHSGSSYDEQRNLLPDSPSGPSIFTALREQLGLRVEATKAPMDIVVIDHVEAPSAN
jgi:uncharacterized protein (TIGR03435 family)